MQVIVKYVLLIYRNTPLQANDFYSSVSFHAQVDSLGVICFKSTLKFTEAFKWNDWLIIIYSFKQAGYAYDDIYSWVQNWSYTFLNRKMLGLKRRLVVWLYMKVVVPSTTNGSLGWWYKSWEPCPRPQQWKWRPLLGFLRCIWCCAQRRPQRPTD